MALGIQRHQETITRLTVSFTLDDEDANCLVDVIKYSGQSLTPGIRILYRELNGITNHQQETQQVVNCGHGIGLHPPSCPNY